MQTDCILIAFIFVIYPQMLIFSVFKIASVFPILITNNTFHITVLLPIYFCDQFVAPKIRHSRRYCRDEDKILIKTLYLKGYAAKRLTDKLPEKSWTSVVLISC